MSENAWGCRRTQGRTCKDETHQLSWCQPYGLGHTGRERRLQAARRHVTSFQPHAPAQDQARVHGRTACRICEVSRKAGHGPGEREVGNTAGMAAGGGLLASGLPLGLRQAQLPVSSKGREEPGGARSRCRCGPCCVLREVEASASHRLLSALPSAQGTLSWEGLVCTVLGSCRDPQQGLA